MVINHQLFWTLVYMEYMRSRQTYLGLYMHSMMIVNYGYGISQAALPFTDHWLDITVQFAGSSSQKMARIFALWMQRTASLSGMLLAMKSLECQFSCRPRLWMFHFAAIR